jgi:hypothetical protein
LIYSYPCLKSANRLFWRDMQKHPPSISSLKLALSSSVLIGPFASIKPRSLKNKTIFNFKILYSRKMSVFEEICQNKIKCKIYLWQIHKIIHIMYHKYKKFTDDGSVKSTRDRQFIGSIVTVINSYPIIVLIFRILFKFEGEFTKNSTHCLGAQLNKYL